MHYNLRVEIERIRGEYVTQIEVSSVGRCRRQRITSPTFDSALSDLKAAHDEMLGEVRAYDAAGRPAEIIPTTAAGIEWNTDVLDPTLDAPPPPAPKKATKAQAKANAKKGAAPKVAKTAARKFAAA